MESVDQEQIGQRIGQYRLVARIGGGGMGVVYKAIHETIGQLAAVKLLRPELSRDASYRRRFIDEARAVSIIQHPSLVKIFDFGETQDGRAYLMMEFLEGTSLRQRMDDRPRMDVAEAMRIGRQVALALQAAHDKDILHRDLKPENLFLIDDPEAPGGERIKLLDFGIAKFLHGTGAQTSAGLILGTATYMSPEQCVGDLEIDGRSDVYSLGVMLHEMLAGQPPFVGETRGLLQMHVLRPPPPLREARPDLPDALDRLIARMLAKEPEERPHMGQVVEEMRLLETGPTGVLPPAELSPPKVPVLPASAKPQRHGRSKPLRVALSVLATLAVGAGAVTAWMRASAPRPKVTEGASTPAAQLSPPPPGMVLIPGGTFAMGSSQAEVQQAFAACRYMLNISCTIYEREQPVRQVRLSPFYLDATEVTNEQFAAWLNALPGATVPDGRIVREGEVKLLDLHPGSSGLELRLLYRDAPFRVRPGHERKPVVQVTWTGAQRFCEARGGSLPTEAQWEFAARGREGRPYPWGIDRPRCDGVVFGRSAGNPCADQAPGPLPVGGAGQDRTPEGVSDLAGNVAEWVYDRLQVPYPLCDSVCADPVVTDSAEDLERTERVYRGNSWNEIADLCRATRRSRWPQGGLQTNLGFRCARSMPPP